MWNNFLTNHKKLKTDRNKLEMNALRVKTTYCEHLPPLHNVAAVLTIM